MLNFLLRRFLWMIPSFFAVSVVAFTIIQLPPGDFVTSYAADLATSGSPASADTLQALRVRYGLDQPYARFNICAGSAMRSRATLAYRSNTARRSPTHLEPAWHDGAGRFLHAAVRMDHRLSGRRLFGVRQYSIGDYVITFLSFLGMATPNFLLALFVMYLSVVFLGYSVGGLFSPEFVHAAWSLGPGLDFLKHLWLPVVVLGVAGIAALVRIMRANLLDELGKPYVETGRAKGLPELTLTLRYPDTGGAEPVRQHGRLGAAGARFGRCHRVQRHEPAHRRAGSDPGAEDPGHVSRRRADHVPVHPGADRHIALRPSPASGSIRVSAMTASLARGRRQPDAPATSRRPSRRFGVPVAA